MVVSVAREPDMCTAIVVVMSYVTTFITTVTIAAVSTVSNPPLAGNGEGVP